MILAYVVGVLFTLSGAMKLSSQQQPIQMFSEVLHFPLWFMYLTGVGETLGGLLLFVRILRLPASLTLALIVVGAIAAHIATGTYPMIAAALILMVLCLLIYRHRYQQLLAELAAEQGG